MITEETYGFSWDGHNSWDTLFFIFHSDPSFYDMSPKLDFNEMCHDDCIKNISEIISI